jgi:hypothetical protein
MKHVWLHIAVILAASVLLVAQGYIGPKGYIGPNGYINGTPSVAVPALIQTNACTGASSPVTCTFTAQAPTAGSTLVFMTFSNGSQCTSVTGAGDTFMLWQQQNQPGTNPNWAAVYVAENVGTSNSFTITCPGSSSFLGAGVYELANVNTADVTGGGIGSTTTMSVSTTFAVGSSTEYCVASMDQMTNFITIAAGAGYTLDAKYTFGAGNFVGASEHINTVTGLSGVQTATMTQNTANFYSAAIVCLSKSAAQGSANDLIDFEGLTNTVAPTVAALTSSIHGPAGGATLSGPATWVVHNPGASITGSTSGQLHNLLTNQQIGATSYTGSGSLGFQYATGTAGDYIQWSLPQSVNTVSVGYWIKTDIPQNESVSNAYSLGQLLQGASDAVNPQIHDLSGSALTIGLECRFAGSAVNIPIATNTVYWLTMQGVTNAGACTPGTNCALDSLSIYDTTGAQVGSTATCSSESGNNPFVSVQIGISGGESQSAGHNIWIDDVEVNFISGTFPLGP